MAAPHKMVAPSAQNVTASLADNVAAMATAAAAGAAAGASKTGTMPAAMVQATAAGSSAAAAAGPTIVTGITQDLGGKRPATNRSPDLAPKKHKSHGQEHIVATMVDRVPETPLSQVRGHTHRSAVQHTNAMTFNAS